MIFFAAYVRFWCSPIIMEIEMYSRNLVPHCKGWDQRVISPRWGHATHPTPFGNVWNTEPIITFMVLPWGPIIRPSLRTVLTWRVTARRIQHEGAPKKLDNVVVFERLPCVFFFYWVYSSKNLFSDEYRHRARRRRKFEGIRPLDHDFRGSGSLKTLIFAWICSNSL